MNINPNKPFYGLFAYKKLLYVKNKDGNLIGITMSKNPKCVFHDLSIFDCNLDHMTGSDTTGHFVYLSSKSQKNLRLANSRTKKIILKKKVQGNSVLDFFGNNRFVQMGGGKILKIYDIYQRKLVPVPANVPNRFFNFWHQNTSCLVSIDVLFENINVKSCCVTYSFVYHKYDHINGKNEISETKKFLDIKMRYRIEGDIRIIAKQNRKIKVFEIDGYCYIFVVTLSEQRLCMIILSPD